ncbi:CsbD family protein [Streptomyces sp. NRRL S-1824]|uniref:CsbD family protein n=1 Tax=Streptomyces sp. NRRL S-1824 TaxID=1463889 RepID=UPI000D14444D|nr:CsbD family protein [Streptomyces sp. NRRL S-1824]
MVKEPAGETGEATGKARKATGKVTGDRQKEAEGTAKRAEDEINKRMRGTQDRPLPQEPPD